MAWEREENGGALAAFSSHFDASLRLPPNRYTNLGTSCTRQGSLGPTPLLPRPNPAPCCPLTAPMSDRRTGRKRGGTQAALEDEEQ